METFQICNDCAGKLGKKILTAENKDLKNGLCRMCWLNFGTFLERQALLEEIKLNEQSLIKFRKENNIKGGILKSIKSFFDFLLNKLSLFFGELF